MTYNDPTIEATFKSNVPTKSLTTRPTIFLQWIPHIFPTISPTYNPTDIPRNIGTVEPTISPTYT